MAETLQELKVLLKNAKQDISEMAKVADLDPARPMYHFHSQSQWMDDPNGIIYHKGYYHMMYSLNPNTDKHRAGMVYKTAHRIWDPEHEDWTGGITVWGHARSKDLVHWEHLPIALYPILEEGEHFIWFGTTAINDNGTPVAIYTSVGPKKRPEDTADQWLWFGDEDLISWTPAKENPVMSYDLHGDEKLTEWRDPFVVKNGKETYLILGTRKIDAKEGRAAVALYQAQNPEFTKWQYKGICFKHERDTVPSCECPNLVKLGDDWLLLISPHGAVEYYVGEMDFEKTNFTIKSEGMVDASTNYYATNVLEDDKGRHIMWGALEGFVNTAGWNGCVSLPREIQIKDGRLIQKPVEELKTLRGVSIQRELNLKNEEKEEVGSFVDGTAEIEVNFGNAEYAEIIISDKEKICFEGSRVTAGGKTAVLAQEGPKKAHIFLDRTIVEMFLEDGSCLTVILSQPLKDEVVSVAAKGEGQKAEVTLYQLVCNDLFCEG